jgi:tetratricopeptide (TPR) repeat protein
VTTASRDARKYFDQGLKLYYGFNHAAAIRSFEHAARLEPSFAMAYWGLALAWGPHINNAVMDEAASKAAHTAVQRALALQGSSAPVERALIAALARRYAWPAPADRRELDVAYADAMREAWRAHPEDVDVGALFAEALMDLRPWDQWAADGTARPETPEVLSTLEAVLEREPNHPGANHFYIHAVEASPDPGRAVAAADRLRDLVPAAGHLVHMPSHIYIRVGRYADASEANRRGIAADLRYVAGAGRKGFYNVYRAHNYHFLAYSAMFQGRKSEAMQAARDMLAEIPLEAVREMPDLLDGFLAVPVHVMVRFGLWDELLAEPNPPDDLKVTTAFWHYGRTVALSAVGRVDEAARSLAELRVAYAAVPESAYIGNNTARVVLELAMPMAEGELEYRRGNVDRAFELLREAVRRDDALKYDEPWGWMQPVRHALGALLLEQGRVAEAEAVYREDLRAHPENGWALLGLAECLRKGNAAAEARAVEARLSAAWANSDVRPKVSCYCRTKA